MGSPGLVDRHQKAVWRYLRVLGASAVEADDLVQETFLTTARRGLAIDPAAERAWLRGVARHLWLRSRRWWRRLGMSTLDPALIQGIEGWWPGCRILPGSLQPSSQPTTRAADRR